MSVNKMSLAAVVALSAFAAGPATAEIIHGDFAGSTVNFLDVTEGIEGYFGAPTVSGDSLSFSIVNLDEESQDGGIGFTDASLSFEVESQSLEGITTLTLEESGAYALAGIGTEVTRVAVAAIFSINILEVDGVAFSGESQIATGVQLFDANLIDSPGIGQAWQATAELDVAALAQGLNPDITGAITRASVVIDNQLLAISEDGTLAFVDKKGFDVVITVPEPASISLLAFGSLCIGARRLRRSA